MRTIPGLLVALSFLCASSFADDWPMYRHDAYRTAKSTDTVAFPLYLQWVYKARRAPEPAWPNPPRENLGSPAFIHPLLSFDWSFPVVASQGRAVVSSSSENKVVCLDAATGRESWSFICGGPVRFPATISGTQVLFGSDDGVVYCLSLADGALSWKTHFNPESTWLPGNNRFICSLPVRTDVLVFNNQAFFGSGLFSGQTGVRLVTLDQTTGTILRNADIDYGQSQFTPQGYLIRRADSAYFYREAEDMYVEFSRLYNSGVHPPDSLEYKEMDSAFVYSGNTRISGESGQIISVNPSWSAVVKGRVFSLAYSERRLIASTDSGLIYCFGPASVASPDTIRPAVSAFPAHDGSYAQAALDIIQAAGTGKGYALVLDNNQGFLAYELARASELQVVCVAGDTAQAALFRKRIDSAGLGGRVTAHVLDNPLRLPFPNHLFNIVTCDAFGAGGSYSGSLRTEAIRVLRPYGGTAFLNSGISQAEEKGPIQGAGEWTHYFGTAGNDLNSNDSFAGSDFQLQWFGRPGSENGVDRHLKGQAPLWKNGILVVPGQNFATAVDAYNGTILWEKAIPLNARLPGNKGIGYMVLLDDYLYAASGNQCLALDAGTGETALAFPMPDLGSGEFYHWGWVACADSLLFGSAIATDAYRYGNTQSSNALAYPDEQSSFPTEVSDGLFAYDRRSAGAGEKWKYLSTTGAIINRTLVVCEDKLIFLASTNPRTLSSQAGTCRVRLDSLFGNRDARLVALDIRTGNKVWEKSVDMSSATITVGMIARQGRVITAAASDSFTTCWYGACRLPRHDYLAFSVAAGDSLWKYHWARGGDGSINDHLLVDVYPLAVGDTLYLAGYYGTRLGLDVRNGTSTDWTGGDHYPGCGIASASRTHLYFRNGNPVACEPISTDQTRLTTVTRPGCWINMIPAGGLMNIPEGQAGCICNYPIQTSMALMANGVPPGPISVMKRKAPVKSGFNLEGFPNPFNPAINLVITLPESNLKTVSFALEIFDVQGRLIRNFSSQATAQSAFRSRVIWTGMDGQGRKVGTGVYYFRLTCGSRSMIRSFVLIK